ncbi:Hypothetical protein CAP_1453 [Chondromyces apiculatus DSM 436]|uniref:Uncharacterized protein n=1 Tax=Chondromyces apiculatus DSM 436 TaxID=1192034 RepID=A0A017TDR8_9BACT|nr:Hypothetical protein CAP_1453 [Chondromyces apiculatus DSM 436]
MSIACQSQREGRLGPRAMTGVFVCRARRGACERCVRAVRASGAAGAMTR